MTRIGAAVGLVVALTLLRIISAQESRLPAWAYGFESETGTPAPGGPPAADDGRMHTLPGAASGYSLTQIRDGFGPADWYPGDHPVMPDIVARGRRPDVRACSLCHYPNGKGRPENAGISGLPRAYFVQAMADFRTGGRSSADTRKANTNLMITIAKGMSDDEIAATADYFGAMAWSPWIKVVETPTVPRTRVAGGMFITRPGSDREPIGARVIEVPEDTERTEMLRDPRSGFIAYVPPGSLARGEELVKTGGGRTTACGVCHGADLRGLGPIPGIAGRSPSYAVRQLYDLQRGTRKGAWSGLMLPVVRGLSVDDLIAVAAYSASK
jgi:cytochrome c553